MEDLEFIGENEIKRIATYDKLITIIKDAFIAYDNENVEMPDKSYVDIEKHNGDFRSMPAYINARGWEASGVKWVNVHPDNTELETVMGTIVYTDPSTGEPLFTMDGTEITKRRTATVSAIATDYLAKDNIETLGILGAGVQSYEQVYAIEEVRDFRKILVSDINEEAIEKFKDKFSNYEVVSTTPNELTKSDVLCSVTPVVDPVITEIHNDSIHINAMGADAPQKQEFDSNVTQSNNINIIVDSYSQAMHSGEISQLVENDKMSRDDIFANLGQIVNNSVESNEMKSQATMFDSTGLAIQDIATAYLIQNNRPNTTT